MQDRQASGEAVVSHAVALAVTAFQRIIRNMLYCFLCRWHAIIDAIGSRKHIRVDSNTLREYVEHQSF